MRPSLPLLATLLAGCDTKDLLPTEDTGGPATVCPPGSGWDGDACVDSVDECAVDNGGCGDPALVTCVERPGEAPACEDIDECAVDNGGCGDPAVFTCVNEHAAPPTCLFDSGPDHRALTDGVQTLVFGNALPSALVVHGLAAFPVALDGQHRTGVAAGRYGQGRFLHVAHEGQLGGALTGEGDADVLVRNTVAWMGGDDPMVGLAPGREALGAFLQGVGVRTTAVTDLEGGLGGLDVLAVGSSTEFTPAQATAIKAFVADGGGLITGGHAWYWGYSNEDAARNHPGNRVLNDLGVTLTVETASSGTWTVDAEPAPPLCHASLALDALLAHVDGSAPLSLDDQRVGVATAGLAVTHLPVEFPWFARAQVFRDGQPPVVPTAADPLDPAAEPIAALVVRVDDKLARELPPEEVTAHPAADDFPGVVPEDAERVNEDVFLVSNYPGHASGWLYANAGADLWLSTGLYAPPGEVIDVTIGNQAVARGLKVSVGSWTDTLWGAETWSRFPRLTRTEPLDEATTTIASAFGGLIYVRVPAGSTHGAVTYEIKGAVRAPTFIRGQTILAEWQDTIRHNPAPWAELVGDRVVLTVPSELVRDLDDPEPLLALWDAVLDADAALSAIPEDRARRERIVVDRQISAGWMHSGYPIMAHLESAAGFVDLDTMTTEGNWGAFHELGHNHQWRDWLLPGTTETTCNLFSVYASEEVLGIPRGEAHSALTDAARASRTAAHLNAGAPFDDWSVWVALETYLQLQEGFGWAPFQAVFAEYQALPDNQRPTTDQARIDQWVERFSVEVGVDLGPFFTTWGLPVSQDVLDRISALPAWADDPVSGG